MNVQFPIRTRQSERNRLAAHLAATVSYLWVKALFSMTLGMLMGASLLTGPRTSHTRAAPRVIGAAFRLTSLHA